VWPSLCLLACKLYNVLLACNPAKRMLDACKLWLDACL
jgi:hypothetical protein